MSNMDFIIQANEIFKEMMNLHSYDEGPFDMSITYMQAGLCSNCGGGITEFKDELSEKEFKLSDLCQECQDEIFNEVFSEDDEPQIELHLN